jgi:HEPN domain-containing protein
MTLRERYAPDDPREWLSRARSNLIHAKSAADGVFLEDLCFDAQQAAEKSIKAVMITRGIDFPYIHNIAKLLSILEEDEGQIPPEILQAERLTRYAHETRYPGAGEPVTQADYERAVALAEAVVIWASALIERADTDPN